MSENINKNSMLRVGTLLHGTYRIDSYLSSGGFGNTYVATNQAFDEIYAVKEFFIKGIAERDSNDTTVSVSNIENKAQFDEQLEKFKKEARRLRKLKCENIVRVHDFFEENGTAYYVMDFIDGENLHKRLERIGQPLTESEVSNILSQVLNALEIVHKNNIYHLDLKPANIMVDKQNCVRLIDFGASKQQSKHGGATTKSGVSYTNGYAPLEQMEGNFKKIGPWTDFYALGATLYKLLTNNPLPSSSEISEDDTEDKHISLPFPEGITFSMRKLIVWLMSQRISDRPKEVQNIYDFLNNNVKCGIKEVSQNPPTPKNEEEVTVLEGFIDVGENGKDEDGTVEAPKAPFIPVEPKYNHKILIRIITLLVAVAVMLFSFNLLTDRKNTADVEYVTDKPINLTEGECSYTGEINKDGVPNGNGIAKFTDGRYYKGPFVNGVLQGDNAIMEQSNGDKFEGSFSDNHYLKGKYTDAQGNYYVGTFRPKGRNAEFLKGTLYDSKGKIMQQINN